MFDEENDRSFNEIAIPQESHEILLNDHDYLGIETPRLESCISP